MTCLGASAGITDTVVAGRYDPSALAALSVGSAIYISIFVTLMGVMQATLPMLSELNGANRPEDMGRLMRQSLYVWLGLSLLGMVLLCNTQTALQWTQVPQNLQPMVTRYLQVLALALPTLIVSLPLFIQLNQMLGRSLAGASLLDGADTGVLADVIAGQTVPDGQVRGFVRKWRARRDSNSRPPSS